MAARLGSTWSVAAWLIVLLALGCRATHRTPMELPCDADNDGEMCATEDDGSARRLRCASDRVWREVARCELGQYCAYAVGLPAGASPVTACVTPANGGTDAAQLDANGSSDAANTSDVAQDVDGSLADTGSPDTGSPDTGSTDTPPPAAIDTVCLATYCPSQAQQCLPVPSCAQLYAKLAACVVSCGGGQGCLTNCQGLAPDARAWQLAVCALLPCINPALCGDGFCSAAESSASCSKDCAAAPGGSCVGHCGGKSAGACYCDPGCLKTKDCCADYAQACGR